MVTPGVHLQDCRDMMADVESNPLLRPFCSDFNDCRSMEVVHYAKFSHSLEEWQSQMLEEGSADDEQESHCEAEQGGLQLSEEDGGGVASASEGRGNEEVHLQTHVLERRDETSSSLPLNEERAEACVSSVEERRAVPENDENEQLNSSNFFSPEITKKNQGHLESKVDKGQWKCHSEESSGWFG